MCTTHFFKKTVFLTGLIINVISSAFLVVLIILCAIQYNYININFTKKLNSQQKLSDFQLSLCILYIFTCTLGFIVFIKHLECKTMQKIYIIYASLTWIYSIIVCVQCFLTYPKIIKNNSDLNCQSLQLSGILKNFDKFENIFYDINKYLCSNDCPCLEDEKMKFQKCQDIIKKKVFNENITNKYFGDNFNYNKFMSYWEKIENKFKCAGFCNISYYNSEEKNITNINKYLFSNNQNNIENYGCLFPLSTWLNKMILSFVSIMIINIILSAICIYICIAILFDKVYEGSNFPQYITGSHRNNYFNKSDNKEINIKNNNNSKNEKSNDVKITSDH